MKKETIKAIGLSLGSTLTFFILIVAINLGFDKVFTRAEENQKERLIYIEKTCSSFCEYHKGKSHLFQERHKYTVRCICNDGTETRF